MILGIDAGNTNIVAALIDAHGVISECRYETKRAETEEYHTAHIKTLLKNRTVCGAVISSVVPEINEHLKKICLNTAGNEPLFVSAQIKTGLDIKYDYPDKLGADLIAAAAGAMTKYKGPVIIVDIGTATTISVVSRQNEYLGGMIAPGPNTSMRALASMTSQLPETQLEVTDKIIGTNTADCIRIGTLTAHAAMIDGMIDRILDYLNISDAEIIATGGRAEEITAMCIHKMTYDKDLLFRGLYALYKMNL